MTTFTKTLQTIRDSEQQMKTRDAVRWMRDRVRAIRSAPAGRFTLGGLYTYIYDPKTKGDLPYYDEFPLIILLETYPDGFLGLNLHYLPPKTRAIFLDKLLPFAQFTTDNDIKRLRITYDILSTTKRFKEYAPCLKMYLNTNIRTRIMPIKPEEWHQIVFMPYEQFRKEKKSLVWKDSIEEIKDYQIPTPREEQ